MDLLLSKETNDDTDVFSEGIESPRCAGTVYDCTKAAQTKGATQLEKVSEFITFINEKFEKFNVDRKQKENEIAE